MWTLITEGNDEEFEEIPKETPLFILIENDPFIEWDDDEDLIPGVARAILVENPLNATARYSWYIAPEDATDPDQRELMYESFNVVAWRREFPLDGMSIQEFNDQFLKALSSLDAESLTEAAKPSTRYIRRILTGATPRPEDLELLDPKENPPQETCNVWLVTEDLQDRCIPGVYDPELSPAWYPTFLAHNGPPEAGFTGRLLVAMNISDNGGLPKYWAPREVPEEKERDTLFKVTRDVEERENCEPQEEEHGYEFACSCVVINGTRTYCHKHEEALLNGEPDYPMGDDAQIVDQW